MKSLFFSQWTKILESTSQFPSNFAINFSAIKHNSSFLFLPQALHTLVKSSLLKCKFLGFSSARVKLCQIPHVNFELTSWFLFKFCIIFPCLDTKLPCEFKAHKLFYFGWKDPIKVSIFRLSNMLRWKFAKFLMESEFSFKCCISIQCHQIKLLYTFLSSNIIYSVQKEPIKGQFMRFSMARVKIRQMSHVSFELTSQFLFPFDIISCCDDT